MANTFMKLIFTGLLVGLFTIAMISGGIHLAANNNSTSPLLDSDAINRTFSSLISNATSSQDLTESQRQTFEKEVPTVGTDSFLFSSIIGAGKVFTGMWRDMFDLTFGLMAEALDLSPIILGLFVSMLLIAIILLAWSLYKAGR